MNLNTRAFEAGMDGYSFSVPTSILSGLIKPIRSSVDALEVILNVARYVQVSSCGGINDATANLYVLTNPAGRIIFRRANGFFSLSFPFSVAEVDGVLNVWCAPLGLGVDSRAIHFVMIFLRELTGRDILDVISDLESDAPDYQDFVRLAIYLLNSDHGYFRLDSDPDNQNGRVHPLNHIDFFYANYSAVKVGIQDLWGIESLKSLVNKAVDRPFLEF